MPAEKPYEYFFYAGSQESAIALTNALVQLDYQVTIERPGADGRFCVTGWTTPIPNDERAFESWYDKMCELAFMFECEFDGYGSPDDENPEESEVDASL